jgi:hypothetical protein
MAYWVKRIALKSGQLLTEKDLPPDLNLFDGPIPVVGDRLKVSWQGRIFDAEVVWGNWPEREYASNAVVSVRVREI